MKTCRSGITLIYWKEITGATSLARLANSLKTEWPDGPDLFLWDILFWLPDKQPWKCPENTKWKPALFRGCASIFTETRSSNTEIISILVWGDIFLSVKHLVINHTAHIPLHIYYSDFIFRGRVSFILSFMNLFKMDFGGFFFFFFWATTESHKETAVTFLYNVVCEISCVYNTVFSELPFSD